MSTTLPRHKACNSRKQLAILIAALPLLMGCSSDSSDWSNLYRIARDSWEKRGAATTLDQAAAIPYATIGVSLDGEQEQILVLATDVDGERMWTSSSKIAISTRNGRIVRTAGLGTDLTALEPMQPGDTSGIMPGIHIWNADFANLGIYSASIRCVVSPGVPDPISILGADFQTLRIDESCQSDRLNWNFKNSYWVTQGSGRVWRAIQHIHPKGPELQIELLRPPVGND